MSREKMLLFNEEEKRKDFYKLLEHWLRFKPRIFDAYRYSDPAAKLAERAISSLASKPNTSSIFAGIFVMTAFVFQSNRLSQKSNF